MAEDSSSTMFSQRAGVDVDVNVVDSTNEHPVWESPVFRPFHVKENVKRGFTVASVKARYECLDKGLI